MYNFSTSKTNRIGYKYYPDAVHYRKEDLKAWLPALQRLGAGWLVLKAEPDRAIPENFLLGLMNAGITPVLHFDNLLLNETKATDDLSFLLDTYRRWGIKYICFFDKPNLIKSWSGAAWGQFNLVERFVELFLPLAQSAIEAGLIPVFPPLEPGGDYWDTAFLRKALDLINHNGSDEIKNNLVIGAYAWTGNQPMNWGAGGPERWAGAKPYLTPDGEEDQIGFRVFDWYNAITGAIFNQKLPVILMGTGCKITENQDSRYPELNEELRKLRTTRIFELLQNKQVSDETGEILEPIPDNVLCGNLWLLTAEEFSTEFPHAFYESATEPTSLVEELEILAQREGLVQAAIEPPIIEETEQKQTAPKAVNTNGTGQTNRTKSNGIEHYLLLPLYEWGVSDWHLDVIKPFVKRHQPTIGFSLYEAMGAKNVTIVSGETGFNNHEIEKLQNCGCKVRVIKGNGTEVASKLANM